MKNWLLVFSVFVLNGFSQTFIPSIAPAVNTIQQGQSTTYSINYTPVSGYNASIFLQLSQPNCLNSSVSLSNNSINFPYPTVTINVFNTSSIPPGVHSLILKSFNGPLVTYDTCKLVVNSSNIPGWFVYNKPNFPLYDVVVEKSLCIKNKTWFFSMCCSYGSPGGTAIMSFDGTYWECWYGGNKHFLTNVCGDTLIKNTVPPLSTAFNLRDMTSYKNDVYYIVMDNIIKFDSLGIISFISVPPAVNQSTNGLYKIRLDNSGKIWLKSLNGLYYQDATNNWQQFSLSGAPFIISAINDFTFDSNNNVWFATSNSGMCTFNGSFWLSYLSANSNLPANSFNLVSKDKLGNIYTCNSNTLYKYSGTNTWVSTIFDNAFTSQATYALAFDNLNNAHVGLQNNYFIQTQSGFTNYTSNNSPLFSGSHMPVSIDFDLNNNIVIADAGGGIVKHGVFNFVTSVAEQKKDVLKYNLFPNPNNGSFKIQIDNVIENGEVVLINFLGEKVFEQKVFRGNNEINTNGLTNGFYYYTLLQNKQIAITSKLIIEN